MKPDSPHPVWGETIEVEDNFDWSGESYIITARPPAPRTASPARGSGVWGETIQAEDNFDWSGNSYINTAALCSTSGGIRKRRYVDDEEQPPKKTKRQGQLDVNDWFTKIKEKFDLVLNKVVKITSEVDYC